MTNTITQKTSITFSFLIFLAASTSHGQPKLEIPKGELAEISRAMFSPDGKWIFVDCEGPDSKFWSMKNGGIDHTFNDDSWIRRFYNSGEFLFGYNQSAQRACVWRASTGKVEFVLQGDNSKYGAHLLSHDDRFIVSHSDDSILAWDASTGRKLRTWPRDTSKYLSEMAIHPTKTLLAVAYAYVDQSLLDDSVSNTFECERSEVIISDFDTGETIQKLNTNFQGEGIYSMAFHPTKDLILAAECRGSAFVWDIPSGKLKGRVKFPATVTPWDQFSRYAAFSPDGYSFVSIYDHSSVGVWTISCKQQLLSLRHEIFPASAEFTKDGKYILTQNSFWGPSGTMCWSALDGSRVWVRKGTIGDIHPYLPLALLYEGTSVRLVNYQSGQVVSEFSFSGNDDWLVKDSSGHFDASPGMLQILHGLKTNQTSVGADKAIAKFHRPGLWKRAIFNYRIRN